MGTGQTEADNAAAAVASYHGALDAYQDSGISWTLDQQVVEMDHVTGNATGSYAVTAATATGGVATESLPFAAQAVIRLRTGVYTNGREVRGRTYLPGLTEAANDDGKVSATYITNLNVVANGLRNDATCEWAIWSRINGTVSEITSVSTWDQFGIMRSRRPGI